MKFIKYFEDKDVWEEYWEEDDDKNIIFNKEFTDFLIDNNAYDKFIYTITQQQLKVKGKSNMALLNVEEVNKIVKKIIGNRSSAFIIYFTIIKPSRNKSVITIYWNNLHKKWYKLWKNINESKDIDWEDFDTEEEIYNDFKVGDIIEVKPGVRDLTTSKEHRSVTPDTPYEPYRASIINKDYFYRVMKVTHKKDGTQVIKIEYSSNGEYSNNKNYWCWFYAEDWQKVNVNESKDIDWEDVDTEEDDYVNITGPIPREMYISEYEQYAGRTIRLKPDTRYYKANTRYNPANMDGILNIDPLYKDVDCEVYSDDHMFRVSWNNGESNTYAYTDLILVNNINESLDIDWEDFDTEEYDDRQLPYDYDVISIYTNIRRGTVQLNCGRLISKKDFTITVDLLDKNGKDLYRDMRYYNTNNYLKDNIYLHGDDLLILLKDKDIMKYKNEIEVFINSSRILKNDFIFDLSIVGGRYQYRKWKFNPSTFKL